MGVTLIVLSSPLQARHAAQYVAHSGIDAGACVVAFVRSRTETDNARTRNALASAGFSQVREFPPLLPAAPVAVSKAGEAHREAMQEYAEFEVRAAFVAQARAFLETLPGPVDRVVLGDYRPVSFRQFLTGLDLAKVDFVLLDDGAVSQAVIAFREDKRNAAEVFRVTPLKPKFIASEDPLKYPDPSRLAFFSIYSGRVSDGDHIIPNRHYDRVLEGLDMTVVDEVWIAGCNHVESKIAVPAEYEKLCAKVRELYPATALVYLPHRREAAEKVEAVAAMLGAEIRITDGLEDFIEARKTAPKALVSFGSTVLDTASRMLKDVTDCLLIVPPASYFSGKRQDHLRHVMAANIANNERVAGLFAADPWASTRLSNRRTLTAANAADDCATNEDHEPFALGAPDFVEGLTGRQERDGARLFLEEPAHGLHRLGWELVEAPPGEAQFRWFRAAGEGRSAVRLRLARGDSHVQCDLDLDVNSASRVAIGRLRLAASCHVDERRRAVVQVLFGCDAPGPLQLQLILRSSAEAKSSFMAGNPTIGVSLPKLPAIDRRGVRLEAGLETRVVQIAAEAGAINALRLCAAGSHFDLLLHPSDIGGADKAQGPIDWRRGWASMPFRLRFEDGLLRSSVPALLSVADATLRIETDLASAQITLPQGADDVFLRWLDPYTGERRVVEVGVGATSKSALECYCLAC